MFFPEKVRAFEKPVTSEDQLAACPRAKKCSIVPNPEAHFRGGGAAKLERPGNSVNQFAFAHGHDPTSSENAPLSLLLLPVLRRPTNDIAL